MRVIAGTRKSLTLKTVPGMGTRPTTDRIKETLFNMLNPYLNGARFLDIFAGSGGIGIEALSRGAAYCCFIEQDRRAFACIKDNLIKTKLTNEADILKIDARKLLNYLAENEPYDIVFMDPPYNNNLEQVVMESIVDSCIVKQDTLYIIEASLETDLSWVGELGLEIIKDKRYKTNKHIFLKKSECI